MANELTITTSLTFVKGNAQTTRNSGSASVTVSGTAYTTGVQSIGTSDETLSLDEIVTPGYLLLHNLNATNFILVGADGSSYPVKLKAGEWGMFRFNGAAIHAKADTGACLLEYYLISD